MNRCSVAPVANLPYRRMLIGEALELPPTPAYVEDRGRSPPTPALQVHSLCIGTKVNRSNLKARNRLFLGKTRHGTTSAEHLVAYEHHDAEKLV
jgi:hypothetical protein